MDQPSAEEIAAAREKGEADAFAAVAIHGPSDPALRVAWAVGFREVDLARAAVEAARQAGATWEQIAALVGAKDRRAAETKYGAGRKRKRAYRARRRGDAAS